MERKLKTIDMSVGTQWGLLARAPVIYVLRTCVLLLLVVVRRSRGPLPTVYNQPSAAGIGDSITRMFNIVPWFCLSRKFRKRQNQGTPSTQPVTTSTPADTTVMSPSYHMITHCHALAVRYHFLTENHLVVSCLTYYCMPEQAMLMGSKIPVALSTFLGISQATRIL